MLTRDLCKLSIPVVPRNDTRLGRVSQNGPDR